MSNTLTLLDYTFSLRAGNLAAAQKAADKLGFAPTTTDLENINNIYDEKICYYCKSVANYTTNRTKEFVKVANSTTQKIETEIKNITKSDELKEIATHIELPSITIEQLSIIRTLKKTYTNAQLQEVFPLAQAIQNYAEKFSTEKIQNQVFENFFPNTKEKLQELLQFYQAAEKITQDISNATDIVQAAIKNKIWEKDFYRVKEVLENGTKTIVNQTVFVATQKFFAEAENLKTRITKYSLVLPELASKKYYELVKRLDVYESYISSKYPLAELAEFQTSAMLALHEQTKNSQYHRYFLRFPHEIKINPTNIFTRTLEESKSKIQNTIDEYLQIGNAEYKKLSSAIIKNKKLIADIQTQKKVLAEKIKLLQYDLYGNFSDDINLHSASASLSLSAIKNTVNNILYLTKPFAENFREIDGQIKSRINKIAYLAETLQILYQETKLSFLSSALLDSKEEKTFLQKINLLASNFINSNNIVSAQYSISQNFSFRNLNEILNIQADSEIEKNRQNFLYRIFYALPQQKEHTEFIRQNILQNKKMPVELKSLTEQQYKNAFGFTTTEPEKLQNKIKEIQKRYGLAEDGILGNNICYLKKDVGEFFGKQIRSIDTKNYSIASLINNPLPETYIYFFKKSLNFLAVVKQQPRWKFPEINSYYADIEGKPETATTTGIIKHFQNYVQVTQTGVIDKDTLQALSSLLTLGLKNSTEDVKTKYNELETIAKNAKSKIEYLQMQKQGIVKQLDRYKKFEAKKKEESSNLLISNVGNGQSLFFSEEKYSNKIFNEIKNTKEINLKKFSANNKFSLNLLLESLLQNRMKSIYNTKRKTEHFIPSPSKALKNKNVVNIYVWLEIRTLNFKEHFKFIEDENFLDSVFYTYSDENNFTKIIEILQKTDKTKYELFTNLFNSLSAEEKRWNAKIYGIKLLHSSQLDLFAPEKNKKYKYIIPDSNSMLEETSLFSIFLNAYNRYYNAIAELEAIQAIRTQILSLPKKLDKRRRADEQKMYGIDFIAVGRYDGHFFNRCFWTHNIAVDSSWACFISYDQRNTYWARDYYVISSPGGSHGINYYLYYSTLIHNSMSDSQNLSKIIKHRSKNEARYIFRYLQKEIENKFNEKFLDEIKIELQKIIKIEYEPKLYRAFTNLRLKINRIIKVQTFVDLYKNKISEIKKDLDNINAQIQQQTNLLLNKSKINQSMLSAEKITEQINFKTSELENAQLSYGRLLLALTELTTQQKTLEDSYNRIKNSFAKKILTSSDPVNNALALASYVPTIAEKVLPNKIVEELKSQSDATLTQAKNFFTSVAQKADTIAKAGANAIMDFKNALIGMDTRIQDWKHKLEIWFDSEKRKVEQYEKELRAELSTPEAIEKIRAEMQRDNTNAMAQTLIEIDAISPVPNKTI